MGANSVWVLLFAVEVLYGERKTVACYDVLLIRANAARVAPIRLFLSA